MHRTARLPPPLRPLRSAEDLADLGLIRADRLPELRQVAQRYAVAITPPIAGLVLAEGGEGPTARQFVPSAAELKSAPEERADPIGDETHSPLEGIVHRYPDRVLLKPTHLCAVYCRFCFRRETVGPGRAPALSKKQLAEALGYIRNRSEIWEVILTGGDPLVLSRRRLREIMVELAAMAHVRVVRVHTRVPIVDPGRVTTALISALKAGPKAAWLVLHVNHPDELTPAAADALARLADAGLPLLSQSVLLRGVNDDERTLEVLLRRLVEHRVKPYYLHHPDLAPGTAHFRTNLRSGQELARGLRGRISGLCQPTYVLDIPGGHGKAPVGPSALGADGRTVTDWRGQVHDYPQAADTA